MSMTLTSLAFEKMCILFNIASTQSSIAANQPFDTDEGLQLGIFHVSNFGIPLHNPL